MAAEPDSFALETLRLREETQRLIDLSRAERRMWDSLVAQSLVSLPRVFSCDDGGTDMLPRHRSL